MRIVAVTQGKTFQSWALPLLCAAAGVRKAGVIKQLESEAQIEALEWALGRADAVIHDPKGMLDAQDLWTFINDRITELKRQL